MTRLLLIVIVSVFVVEVVKSRGDVLSVGLSVNGARVGLTLVDMGALVPPLVAAGQWWRLLTSMFLHLSLVHIAFNAYALWLLGTLIEPSFGRVRFLLIFLISGFLGSVASYVYGEAGGVGASGAIFGLLGALVAYNLRRRNSALAQAQLRWAATLLILNAVLALGIRQIDWRAHLGGFLAGLAAGVVLEGVGSRRMRLAVQVAGTIALIGVGVVMAAAHTQTLRG
jgi:rhomboid protease GluP